MMFRLVEDGFTVGEYGTLEEAMLQSRDVEFWALFGSGAYVSKDGTVRIELY